MNSCGQFQSSLAMKRPFKKYLICRQVFHEGRGRHLGRERVQFGDERMSHFSGFKISHIPLCKILTARKTCCCLRTKFRNTLIDCPNHIFSHKKQTRRCNVCRHCLKLCSWIVNTTRMHERNTSCHTHAQPIALSSPLRF